MENEIKEYFNKMHPIPSEDWEEAIKIFKVKVYKKNEFFIQPQELPLNFGIVKSGIFRLYYIDEDGKEWIKAFRSKGQLVGAYSEMIQMVPSRTFIQAINECEVYEAKASDLEKISENKMSLQILRRKIAEWHFVAKENREYEFLKLTALERYNQFKTTFPEIFELLPDYLIASYLGITPQALSRLQRPNG